MNLPPSIPLTSLSGFFRAPLPEGKLRSVMFVGLTTAPTSAAVLGAAIVTQHLLPSLSVLDHARPELPPSGGLSVLLAGLTLTCIFEGTEPLVVMPFSGWGCRTCPPTVTIVHGSTNIGPSGSIVPHVLLQVPIA